MNKMSTREFYEKIEELHELEINEPYNKNLTYWFGDYGMHVPKPGVSDQEILEKIERIKKGL